MQKMNRNKLKRQRRREKRKKMIEAAAGSLVNAVVQDLNKKKNKAEQEAEALKKVLGTLVGQAKNINPGPDTYVPAWEEAVRDAEKALE